MKVSIITVCFNSQEFIRMAIESVLKQDYINIEYIVIDGASSDATLEIIDEYHSKITRIVSEPDKGIYDAMNKGISLATGDIIGILNSDDFYCKNNVISQVVSAFKNNTDAALILGNVDFVEHGELTKPIRFYSSFRFTPWKMRFGFMPAHPSAFIKKYAYDVVGLYKLNYKIGADFDMFVRMLVLNKLPYKPLNCTLVRMRVGGVSTSGIKSFLTSTKEMYKSLKENKIYSNYVFLFVRFPIKYSQLIMFKLGFR